MGYRRSSKRLQLQLFTLLLLTLPSVVFFFLLTGTSPITSIKNTLSEWLSLEIGENREAEPIIELYSAEYFREESLSEKGEYNRASSFFRQAIEVDPNYTPAYNNLGLALLEQKKSKLA